MKPSRVEFDVGYTRHNQRIRLIRVDGEWTIHKEAINQRDQDDYIRCLSGDVILAMADAVKSVD